jgi:septal ring factor EnvC (AmiA/AmiB activator)
VGLQRARLTGLIAIFVAVLSALPLVLATGAAATDLGTLQARVANARTEARTLASTVQVRNAAFQAAAAARRLAAVEAELAHGQARLAVLEGRVRAATARLRVAQARFHREQGKLARRLVAIYKSGTPDVTSLLLDSTSFSDLLTRESYLRRINQADSALVARVQLLRDRVRAALTRVEALRGEAASEVARLRTARAQASSVRRAAAERSAAAGRARAAAQAALSNLHSRIAGWTAQVAELQRAMNQSGNAGQTVSGWVGDFAIPQAIVMCESGGNYGALNPSSGAGGAYQMLPETYKGLGGKYQAPQLAPKWEQDQLAAKLWAGGQGAHNWECAG